MKKNTIFNNTRKLSLLGILLALGVIISLIKIPWPLYEYLNISLGTVMILFCGELLGFTPMLIMAALQSLISLLQLGPVGPLGIGQVMDFIASFTLGGSYLLFKRKNSDKTVNLIYCSALSTLIFTVVLVVLNYLFVHPSYMLYKLANFSEYLKINNISNSTYIKTIISIYTPFNIVKASLLFFIFFGSRRVVPTIKKRFRL